MRREESERGARQRKPQFSRASSAIFLGPKIEIIETIAIVHREVEHWSGKLAGANAWASDVFTLLKCDGEWQNTYKLFHWRDR